MDLYKKYYDNRNNDQLSLFKQIAEKYNIKSALYPGSFVHITPSFVISRVTYVDNNKQAKKFFDSSEYKNYIEKHKKYQENPQVNFIFSDYSKDLDLATDFDLLISQFAGFVSESCSKYLKKGGILLANDSHGDASMAHLNPNLKLIGIIDKGVLNNIELDEYFITKNSLPVSKNELLKTMKGISYIKKADNYLFEKLV